ncbi:hypothetical protein [Pinirhizobacter sp.]|uniref:hypothetical protein n=1 Tax=Pinirhizobacter sp. TaxID=2950432 RepID=UPI002F3F4249
MSTRLASVNDEGMHLEVLAKEDSLPYSSELLFSVVAVEGEKLLLEFLADKVFVRVPIEDVERALVMARSQVHSEGWYP